MTKVVWMFSGQGSQYFGMGSDLYASDPVFRDRMDACDAHCERVLGRSLLAIMHPEDPSASERPFEDLRDTHPALLCIQYSLAQTLLRRGMAPDLLLGYSLGEWVALTLSGALPFVAALESLARQAELLTTASTPGAMLAIMAPIEEFDASWLCDKSSFAAYNMANHVVVSGPEASMRRVQRELRERDITHQRLPVRVAFHSPCMDDVEAAYRSLVEPLRPGSLAIPLVSLAHAQTLRALPEAFYWNVLRRPVQFERVVRGLEREHDELKFVDLGPSGTLATFVKYVRGPDSRSSIHPILSPFRTAKANLDRLEDEL